MIVELVVICVAFFGNLITFDPSTIVNQVVTDVVQSSKESGIVYIQVPNDSAKKEAEKLQSFLVGKGYVAPGIEIVGVDKSPPTSEIRYFYSAQVSRAEKLRTEMVDFGLTEFQTKQVKGYEGKANPEVLEIWYKKGA